MTATAAQVTAVETHDLQGLVARSFARLKHASYVPFALGPEPAASRAWVGALAERITPATRRSHQVLEDGEALNVAFTRSGFERLGLSQDAIATFSREFQEGMATEHRKRVLGDLDEADPAHWRWGGPANPHLDGMLFVFAEDPERLQAMLRAEAGRGDEHGVALGAPLGTVMLAADKEHFGFHDGLAQPRIGGLSALESVARSREPEIPAGEVILGYTNAYGKLPDSPHVPDAGAAREILPEAAPDPDDPYRRIRRDLGRNGSYMVIRQLEQDVKAFWRFLDARSGGDPERRKWLGAKMVGRWPNGAPLVLHPEKEPPEFDRSSANDFLYTEDLQGERCPVGAHVRRTNPRDGMQPSPAESLLVADRHRLLRRGRAYGPPLAESLDPSEMLQAEDPAAGERGLHFICFNSDIVRQFEFVQNTWVNSMKFDGLYSDPDPLIAPHVDPTRARAPEQVSAFTVQQCPVRHRERGLPRAVWMRGGAYLFMPGRRALRYLAALD